MLRKGPASRSLVLHTCWSSVHNLSTYSSGMAQARFSTASSLRLSDAGYRLAPGWMVLSSYRCFCGSLCELPTGGRVILASGTMPRLDLALGCCEQTFLHCAGVTAPRKRPNTSLVAEIPACLAQSSRTSSIGSCLTLAHPSPGREAVSNLCPSLSTVTACLPRCCEPTGSPTTAAHPGLGRAKKDAVISTRSRFTTVQWRSGKADTHTILVFPQLR